MGRQINFFLLPEDLDTIERVLRDKVEFSIWEYESNSSTPQEATFLNDSKRGLRTVYLSLPHHGRDIVCHKVENQGYWVPEVYPSPVIEFDLGYFNGRILRPGRVYYLTGYYGDDDTWVDKPTDFVKWAEKIFRLLKKVLKRLPGVDGYYYGERALEWVKSGAVRVDQYTWEKRDR